MLKIVFPCPRQIPWVLNFLTCVTGLPSMKVVFIRRIGKALCYMLEYTIFCEYQGISLIFLRLH